MVDLIREAQSSVGQNPVRALLTALGTILGTAAFVSTLGIASTLSQQVSEEFDSRRATEVLVTADPPSNETPWLDAAALDRVRRLNGVATIGRMLTGAEFPVARDARGLSPTESISIVGADPAALEVIAPTLVTGRLFDRFHEDHTIPVALLASSVANRLDIASVGGAIFIEGSPYLVIGIFDDVERREETLVSLIVPYSAASALTTGLSAGDIERRAIIEVLPGAGQTIAGQAPTALRPENPTELLAISPPDPTQFRRTLESNVAVVTISLSIVALVIGSISIASAATAAIMNRIAEIGLRRAVGARRLHIFAQLLMETALLGAVGGALGALIGVAVTVALATWNQWAPVIDLRLALLVAIASALAGAIAGLVPAGRAVKIQPVDALRHS